MNKKNLISQILILFALSLFTISCGENKSGYDWEWEWDKEDEDTVPVSDKPMFIWISSGASFDDFANSKENILRDLTLAKESGFTDIIVDVYW